MSCLCTDPGHCPASVPIQDIVDKLNQPSFTKQMFPKNKQVFRSSNKRDYEHSQGMTDILKFNLDLNNFVGEAEHLTGNYTKYWWTLVNNSALTVEYLYPLLS